MKTDEIHYQCPMECCEVHARTFGGNASEITYDGVAYSSFAALAEIVGLSAEGLRARIYRHGCLKLSRKEANALGRQKRQSRDLRQEGEPLAAAFLALRW